MIKPWCLLPIVLTSLFSINVETFQYEVSPPHHSRLVNYRNRNPTQTCLWNSYDDWRSHVAVDIMNLDEENVLLCLDEFIYSDFGRAMFGVHDVPAKYGITGSIELVEVCGPEVILRLEGKFWHKRSHVLGLAAMWLNARMPEITDVNVEDIDELNDFDEIRDEFTGDIIEKIDRRSPDFNGDRQAMEYQGINPDMRGPFPG